MMPEQQQRILGYFIEEAKDHLNTIEQGLLNLQTTIQDPEMVTEVFRAAHSVKGGAAMLSLGSIQQTSHRLEDYFKILKEAPTTQVDRDLETMFLQVFDGLQALLEELQGPFGLTEEKAQEVMADIEPVFDRLETHLNELVEAAPAAAPESAVATATAAQPTRVIASSSEDSALKLVFSSDVPGHLREMLALFKRTDTDASRAALQACCDALKRVGEQFDLSLWCDLATATRQAVGNPEQTYRSLAPVVIKELKRAQEQVLAGQANAIVVSAELESLMPLGGDSVDAVGDIDSLLDDALSTTEEPDFADLFEADAQPATAAEADLDWLDLAEGNGEPTGTSDDLSASLSELTDPAVPTDASREPTVGTAELNSLADLFEGEVAELDSPWEEISESEAAIADTPGPDIELDSDFSDLLESSLDEEDNPDGSSDLADLFGDTDDFGDDAATAADSSPVAEADDDFEDLLNLADTPAEPHARADIDDAGLDSLLDGLEVEGEDTATTGDDFDLGLADDSATALDLEDLELDDTPDDVANGDDFGNLFGAEEVTSETETDFGDWLDTAEAGETAEALDVADAVDTAPASAAIEADSDSFNAIADPWSTQDVAEEDESALDALDELWTEQAPTAETNVAVDAADPDFSDFPDLEDLSDTPEDEATAESSDDFEDLFTERDESVALGDANAAAVDTGLDDAAWNVEDLSAPVESDSSESADSDFDDLLNDAADSAANSEATDQGLGDLFDDSSAAVETDNLDFLEGEIEGDSAPDDDGADLDDLFGAEASFGESREVTAEDAAGESADAFDSLLDDAEDASADFDLGLEDSTENAAADFDLTFADSGEEELSLAADDDFSASSDEADGAFELDLDSTTETDASGVDDDLFADAEGALTDASAIASETAEDDFFGSDEAAEPTGALADTPQDDIDDFFSTSETETTEAAAAVDEFPELADAGAAEESAPSEATETEADAGDLDLDFAAEATVDDATAAASHHTDDSVNAAATSDMDTEELNFDSPDLSSDGFDDLELLATDEQPDDEASSLFDAANPESESDAEAEFGDLDFDLGTTASDDEATEAASSEPEDFATNESFDDLDAMLGEEAADVSAVSAIADTADTDPGGFDELDALIDTHQFADEPDAATDEGVVNFDELDALIGDDQTSVAVDLAPEDEGGDDFGDLEKLLEEADQTLGGSSSSIRASGPGRSSRRVGGIVDQTMRVSVKHLDNLNNLVGELVVNRNSLEQDQDRFRQFLDNLLFQVQQLNDVGQRMRDLYERSLLESSLLASRQAFQSGGSRLTSTTNGSNGDSHATGASFDALEMDRFTGFHTLTQEMIELIVRVRESSSDIAYTVESTDQIARQFRQVTTQLQEGLNKARMVPFAQTADRLPRAVRDISIRCGKEARLIVEGRDTLIDKMLLERLYDPMTHLVNNAITHGIESPEERAALGKPREGKITVRAFYQGNQTVIYIEDDGAGINPNIVKSKAIQKGLITQAEADRMNILETYELIFRHGFSTRDQADDFAGRGVGMDVVRSALSEIRGSINIDSELGKGTSFTIRLPLTLSISKALSCLNNQARIAFPMDGVEDMFDVPRDRIQTNEEGQSFIQWRDLPLTFQPLSELLQFNRALGRGRVYGGSQDDDMVSIVVLRNANTYIGIQVDRVLGEQEIVIKQIEGPVPKPMGIAGATVLGDGRVMPIGDVLELIDIAQGRVRREAGSSLWAQVELPPEDEEPVKTEPTVLIVDDSITVRELLSMSFNKVGYRVEQARDGQEAWEKMRSGLPCDLVFCDIEMPRMDGLELLSRMQKDSALKNIPIAMLTSRGADRHRQMAVDLGASGYFTKPYLEEALLEAAQRMLKGEVLLTSVAAEEAE